MKFQNKRIYHSLTNKKLYPVWNAMKQRCYNKKNKSYINYGARGISICDDWMQNFEAFYDWCIFSGWQEGLQIDRINNNGNYCPENCRFIKQELNVRNKRSTIFVDLTGKLICLKDACNIFNVSYGYCRRLIKGGMTANDSIIKCIVSSFNSLPYEDKIIVIDQLDYLITKEFNQIKQ